MDKQEIDIEKFISLKTTKELFKKDRTLWLDLVKEYGPSDIINPIQIYSKTGRKSIKLFFQKLKNEYEYTVSLKRDLLPDEVEKIVEAWDMYYPSDFEIESSSTNYLGKNIDFDDVNDEEVENSSEYDLFTEELSKLNHATKIKKMQDNGWRYGDKYSLTDKTSPELLPWEQLSEKNKFIDYDYAEKVITLLEQLGYKIEEE